MKKHQSPTQKMQEPSHSLPSSVKKNSPYAGLDRMSMLVSSLGTLRLALMNTVNTNASLDTGDCHALAAFVTLLEEELENVIEELYPARQK
ncbi:hypothetical protein NB640_11310 [Oxalobacter vibrioformis]|uniref:Uncharacterized protein n=1 Tax=Oxalobacter vibrioformis TaxID=933080 RepID=A0A9E9LW58_9BURK|nr:hypothetical protein [Oxalobacter vibrioformis]NLC23444.1 hypothetical protein [Oxalobacter sp.]WAW09797.1 hypothetical protein NB640_11310 [Oxalobacter vibrioformis]